MALPNYSWNIVNRRVHLDGSNTIEYKTYKEIINNYKQIIKFRTMKLHL